MTNKANNPSADDEKKPRFKSINIDGDKYKTHLTPQFERRKKWAPVNEKHEISFIPGTIIELFVKEGHTITKGEPLMVLEAMKMENTIYAPFNGSIKKVNISKGERVPKGKILLEYS